MIHGAPNFEQRQNPVAVWLELTSQRSGQKVWVDFKSVSIIVAHQGGSRIRFDTDEDTGDFDAAEAPEHIISQM
jgi:hypothetical protein